MLIAIHPPIPPSLPPARPLFALSAHIDGAQALSQACGPILVEAKPKLWDLQPFDVKRVTSHSEFPDRYKEGGVLHLAGGHVRLKRDHLSTGLPQTLNRCPPESITLLPPLSSYVAPVAQWG